VATMLLGWVSSHGRAACSMPHDVTTPAHVLPYCACWQQRCPCKLCSLQRYSLQTQAGTSSILEYWYNTAVLSSAA
jgi:hypothetical protein